MPEHCFVQIQRTIYFSFTDPFEIQLVRAKLKLPRFSGLSRDFKIWNIHIQPMVIRPGVVVGRHLALGRVEPELLEQAGDDQEQSVLSQDLKSLKALKERTWLGGEECGFDMTTTQHGWYQCRCVQPLQNRPSIRSEILHFSFSTDLSNAGPSSSSKGEHCRYEKDRMKECTLF